MIRWFVVVLCLCCGTGVVEAKVYVLVGDVVDVREGESTKVAYIRKGKRKSSYRLEQLGVHQQSQAISFSFLESVSFALLMGSLGVHLLAEIVGITLCIKTYEKRGELQWGIALTSMGMAGTISAGIFLLVRSPKDVVGWVWASAFFVVQVMALGVGVLSALRYQKLHEGKEKLASFLPWMSWTRERGFHGGMMWRGRF